MESEKLTVNIIDGGKILKTRFPIFKDDSIRTIKEKIYSLSYFLSPELVKLNVKNKSIVLEDDKYLYEYNQKKGDIDNVWITNVLSSRNDITIQQLRDSWSDLSDNDSMIIFKKVVHNVKGDEYDLFMKNVELRYNTFDFNKFRQDRKVDLLQINPDLLFKENGKRYKKIKSSVIILNINRSLDLSLVFKHLKLDEEMPFMIYKENIRRVASVKIFKKLPKNLVKEWSLQDNKGVRSIKGGKGLNFRVKYGDGYSSVNITNKIITIKCEFSNTTQNSKTCVAGIGEALDKINDIEGFEIISQDTKFFSSEFILNTTFDMMDFGLYDFDIFFEYAPVPEKERVSDVMHIRYIRAFKPIDIFIRGFQDRKSITIQTESDVQLELILFRILQLVKVFPNHVILDNTIRDISNVSKLKKTGAITNSTSCQKQRQPVVNSSIQPVNVKDSYDLNYKDIRYVCPTELYPYPGFTQQSTPCCFKANQKSKPVYQKTMFPNLGKVYPSNLPIKISKDTFLVLKDENDEYLYLNNEGERVDILDQDLLDKIQYQESRGNIWLNLTPLNQLLNNAISSKCGNQPDNVLKRDCSSGSTSGNAKIFGYHSSGIPCCFSNKRDIYTDKKKDSGHIITTDKILDFGRQGELYDILKPLFTPTHLRHGILQSNLSFFESCTSSINIKIDSRQLLKTIAKFTSIDIYHSLFGISELFSFDEYLDYLKNNWIDHEYASELASQLFKVNIIVLNFDGENSSISCRLNLIDTPFDDSFKYIVLIKNKKTYEPIKRKKNEINDGIFDRGEVQNLIDLYTFSCKTIKPDDFALNLNELLLSVKEPKKISIIINNAKYVNFVKYNDFLIPVKASKPISKLPTEKMRLYDAEYQIKKLNGLNIPELKVAGQIISTSESSETTGEIIALITVSDLILPVLHGKRIENLSVFNLNYYENINEILQMNNTIDDKRILNVLDRLVNEEYMNRIYYVVSEYLKDNDDIKDSIIDIKSEKSPRNTKVKQLGKIIQPIVKALLSSDPFDSKTVKLNSSTRHNCSSYSDEKTCNIKDYCSWGSSQGCSLKSFFDKSDIILNIIQNLLKSDAIIQGISNEMISLDNFINRKSEITFINPEQIDRWLDSSLKG
jgi:hypothetical protein